ncbi:MAG: pyridoxal 5'-phosphate synthase glutaminase subunit PdxT [Acidobacteria bacterium]|nr:pyridoxal 5'-phosphate synthase glutaminase subunit PdxT [Acidobacteriota bacterium]NIM62787.1 pyridoxal 5'-phosphate synthase glutaminase subunit PdxT [Acidobacteriota bacterium]NIO60943.1 pyridoxal 5'-phosphate synthase glutaminase subunit PdxT [Acidobacteriota bacterium]NIQ31413.1 pyridoxal 5'-phosphate synthase glutaminase subunit PdxT [Acidobacteriota bacterium]NIQ87412.1 pyridoxal 5'-phosphate synthase glutaminase subunit PdxT [Acidobacteriota bacterium]
MRIGVLALQGGFEAHARVYAALGVNVVEVRRVVQLRDIDGLVLPGGESTTLLKLMEDEPWFEALSDFHADGKALFATCAGAILLAREVLDSGQRALGLLDASIRRNAFGRQIDSFEADLALDGEREPLRAVFIRAPRFTATGPDVEVLARLDDEPVLVLQDNILAATFHPELTADPRIHCRFLDLAAGLERPVAERATGVAAG